MSWGLGLDVPITNMIRVLENGGVVVTEVEGGEDRIDAFSRMSARPVVVLNTDKGSSSRRTFDLAHELGHLVAHVGRETGENDTERDADRFASAFLLPRVGFLREFPHGGRLDWDALFRLKQRWGTSIAALVHRAYDLRLIDAAEYQRAFRYMSARGWRRGPEPAEPETARPELVHAALSVLAEDGWSTKEVARHLGWTPGVLAKVVTAHALEAETTSTAFIGIEPDEPARVVSLADERARRRSS